MNDIQGLLYQIREISTDHLERPHGHGGEEEKLVEELERITVLSEAAIAALVRGRG